MGLQGLNISLRLLGMRISPGQALIGPLRTKAPKIACGRRGYCRKE